MAEASARVVVILTVEEGGPDPAATAASVRAQDQAGVELVVEESGGDLGARLRRGLDATAAELVMFLRPTETLDPGAVSHLVTALDQDPEAVAANAWFRLLGVDGRELGAVAPVAFDVAYAVRLHDFPIGPATLVRRQALSAIGGPDETLDRAALDDLWIRLGRHGRFATVQEALGERRAPGLAGSAEERERMARERVTLIDKIFEAPPVPFEFESITDQAYRNAFVYAATLVATGFSGPEERFYVADRLDPSPPDPAQIEEVDGRLMERVAHAAQLENELAWRSAAANFLRAGIAEREALIEELRNPSPRTPDPPLLRAAKQLTPASLRPAGRRLLDGARARRRGS